MKLIELHSSYDNSTVWVNPDRILFVEPNSGCSKVYISDIVNAPKKVLESPREINALIASKK